MRSPTPLIVHLGPDAFIARHPGVVRVFTAKDVPGENCYGVIPPFADQPVFAKSEARFRGEAAAAIVGEAAAVEALDLADFPITWQALPAMTTLDAALAPDAPLVHSARAGNILVRGRVAKGNVEAALAKTTLPSRASSRPAREHAYNRAEAGFARRVAIASRCRPARSRLHGPRDIAKLLGPRPRPCINPDCGRRRLRRQARPVRPAVPRDRGVASRPSDAHDLLAPPSQS